MSSGHTSAETESAHDGSSPGIKRRFKTKSPELWLTSFCDLSLILMCFFALQLSFSKIDKSRFENVNDGAKNQEQPKSHARTDNLKTISEDLMKQIQAEKINAHVDFGAEGVVIELDDQLFFRSGSAMVDSSNQAFTSKLLNIIARTPQRYKMVFEGHTDDIPTGANSGFKSNWELSSARALSMLNEMKRLGVPEERMSIVSYAQTRPKVALEGKNSAQIDEARRANRRVVIRLE